MNTKIALLIVGIVLLLVVLTMGEDGTVSQIAERGSEAGEGQVTETPPTKAATSTAVRAPGASRDWYASTPQVQKPEIPIYHHNETHVTRPPVVIDRKVAAAGPIQ